MKIVENLRKRSRLLTLVSAFLAGSILVQFVWAFEFYAAK